MTPSPNQLPFDLKQTTGYTCQKCGHDVFVPVVFLRRIPGLLVGSAQDQVFPIQTFSCVKCNETQKDMIPKELQFDASEEVKETPKPSKGIILG